MPELSDLWAVHKVLKLETESHAEFLTGWRKLSESEQQELGTMARQHIEQLGE